MFEWLQSRWRGKPLPAKSLVSFNERLITCRRSDGTSEEVTWDELTAVEILTTDAGPIVCDVFYVLHGKNRGCVVPQDVDGCNELLERLQKLPGFNNQAVIDAMSCTSNSRFHAWQKDNTPASSAG